MEFEETSLFVREFNKVVESYFTIDAFLGSAFIKQYDDLKERLAQFPESCPKTSDPEIRKYIFKKFPYRLRYIYSSAQSKVTFLTVEHMHDDYAL